MGVVPTLIVLSTLYRPCRGVRAARPSEIQPFPSTFTNKHRRLLPGRGRDPFRQRPRHSDCWLEG